jgi:CheY-like chemotaxis protein
MTAPARSDTHILIVDDQVGVRTTLKAIFTRRGYSVRVAEDGEHALELAASFKFDVIFMDVKMPGISGVDAFIRIKFLCPDARVILMTAFALDEELSRAVENGVYSIVSKPFDVNALIALLEKKAVP